MKKISVTSLSILFFISVFLPVSVFSQDISKHNTTHQKSKKTFIQDKPDINTFIPVDEEPVPLDLVRPEYPEVALKSGVKGLVYVKVLIDENGKPDNAVVIKSAAGILNNSVINSALKSTFSPAVKEGQKISCWTIIRYSFRLLTDIR
jgi:TonB family protein